MILVTGGSGFVGMALLKRLLNNGLDVRASVRNGLSAKLNGIHYHLIHDMTDSTDWTGALASVQSVVHCAARVHIMRDDDSDPLEAYRQVNVRGTLNLASQAAVSGVKRFVFVSSIKVNGEETKNGHPFTADDTPAPQDPYGVSKLEAEEGLQQISSETGMEIVIVRPPLVYGPGVKANFASMVRWVSKGLPLPLGNIGNRRSMVALDNLVDLLATCVVHSAAAGQTFLVSDGEDVSTTELLRRTAIAMGKPAHLLPIPEVFLRLGATLLGKRELAQRLCGSLQVDIEKTHRLLNWQPPLTLDQGLKKAVLGMDK